MFNKILIANRGEIACRVLGTARSMGIRTVAVYSEADRQAPHVQLADEAVAIGPPPATESYLDIDAIVAACLSTGAQAVHPGYGFLSENPRFAERLSAEGIVFIGPGRGAIEAMGDKITSKRMAIEAGVNVIPGSDEVIRDAAHAVSVAADIGYPVMIKASAGGGGKGMRIAVDADSCREGFERASSEARSSFGDDRVFIEKFITEPRHIEIQVLADAAGSCVHLGERECSLQRRHQKVIEEAPSPFLDAATREAMGTQAVTLATAVDYQSAGTVEFIVDAERNFYFLEMNTRLQVEHPVTELVTGLDLVEQMIRIAAGEPLAFSQAEVRLQGWAMEARIYAEDPFRGFVPSTGRLRRYITPPAGEGVRLDTGVEEGSEVSMFYDPMIAKLIGYGDDRREAADRLSRALDAFHIDGVSHNIPFLQCLVNHPRFREGKFSTAFIEEQFPGGFSESDARHVDRDTLIAVAAFVHAREQERAASLSGRTPGARSAIALDWVVMEGRRGVPVRLQPMDGGWDVLNGERRFSLRSQWQPGERLGWFNLNGDPVCFQIERRGVFYHVAQGGASLAAQVLTPRAAALAAHMLEVEPPDLSRFVLSPMPGLLVSLAVTPGQRVATGDEVAVVEAMKMENSLRAGRDGVVIEVLAAPGDSLAVDQPIIELG